MLERPQLFGQVDENASKIVCPLRVILDVEIRIRHAHRLLIRQVPWYVCTEEMDGAILGQTVLRALGIDTEALLIEICDKNNGEINFPKSVRKLTTHVRKLTKMSVLVQKQTKRSEMRVKLTKRAEIDHPKNI